MGVIRAGSFLGNLPVCVHMCTPCECFVFGFSHICGAGKRQLPLLVCWGGPVSQEYQCAKSTPQQMMGWFFFRVVFCWLMGKASPCKGGMEVIKHRRDYKGFCPQGIERTHANQNTAQTQPRLREKNTAIFVCNMTQRAMCIAFLK